eukprot:GDKK01015218.1.p1 GENE.GDKK01015218.1~~GDKK01015218.1.p1  ORF type:complete len:440 (+),score=12.09 GDKK01015218.1:1-1320(+)
MGQGKANTSNYGRWLLHRKIVHFLSERLGVEDAFRHDGQEINSEKIIDPIFLVGLPRVGNHLIAHVLARSGVVTAPSMRDTMFPSKMSLEGRSAAYRSEMRFFQFNNPEFRAVRTLLGPRQVDDDISLQLQSPYSIAWGLLHGLDDLLLESLQHPQDGVYAHNKKILQLFQFYRRLGMFEDGVVRETNPINNMLQEQREGYKASITYQPYVVHSPLALLSLDSLSASFEDMNLLWTHRNLSQALSSFCSSLAIHQSLYTGKSPSETQLGTLGEKTCGLFGSGTENAIDFLANFPKHRLLNVASVDSKRSTTRISQRVLEYFGHSLDKWRKMQAIDGQTEYANSAARPSHEHKLSQFGLHEGVIAEHFDAYCFQFQEYAFMEMPGIRLAVEATPAHDRVVLNPQPVSSNSISGSTSTDKGQLDGAGPGAKDDAPAHMIQR